MADVTPLDGIRVLDFTRILAGPFCTMLLADFGADVIKVERPHSGDDTRQWGPPWAGDGANKQSAYYLSVNRNKRSLTLDLKSAEGQEVARQLALKSHILIENFKVGQMAEYRLDYETLHVEHPSLVYCSITGYGQTGPYANIPGYDYAIQGQSGLMSITGPEDGMPYKIGVAISDVLTGMMAANAIQAALFHSQKTGQGQFIDIALLDTQIASLVNVASNYLVSGSPPIRYGNAHANIVPYQTFEASDGYFILNVGNDRQFKQLCAVIEQPELAQDQRFATNPARVENRDTLIAILVPLLRKKNAAHWIKTLRAAGVPASPINDIPTALSDEHAQARELVQTVALANGTLVNLLAPVTRFSVTPATLRRPPPLLGQHTDEILQEWLGMSSEIICLHRGRGII